MRIRRRSLLTGRLMIASMMLAAGRPVLTQAPTPSVEYSVTVYQAGGGEPGVPILVRLKNREGLVVAESRTGASGTARLRVSGGAVPATVEALLDLGSGRNIGVIDTINSGCNSYEVFLPQFRALQCHGLIERAK
jgi:hypothetical protein